MNFWIILVLALISLTNLDHVVSQNWQDKLGNWSLPATTEAIRLSPIQQKVPVKLGIEKMTLAAKGVYGIDLATGQILFEQSPDQELPIASITKLVTAMVILENHSLTETIEVKNLPTYSLAAEKIGLTNGEKLALGDLLKGALIASGNDAADTLAIYDSDSITAFSNKMNNLVSKWDIDNAHFSNASGLIDNNNYASARALGQLAMIALKNPFLAETVKTKSAIIKNQIGKAYTLTNTNQLLAAGFSGIKTGYTPAAGQSLVALSTIDTHPVITIVLGSPDRFGETSSLVNWIGRNWQWL